MSEPYLGEIRIFAGTFAPRDWAFCDGRTLAISQYEALYNLIGTTYGGDGQTTFAVPDLRSRVPLHQGQGPGLTNRVLGQNGGVETVTLLTNQLPVHTHPALCNASSTTLVPSPSGAFWGNWPEDPYSDQTPPDSTMSPTAVGLAGGNQPHENMIPYVAVNYIIALFGVFPSQN